jgi:hypothetical protein
MKYEDVWQHGRLRAQVPSRSFPNTTFMPWDVRICFLRSLLPRCSTGAALVKHANGAVLTAPNVGKRHCVDYDSASPERSIDHKRGRGGGERGSREAWPWLTVGPGRRTGDVIMAWQGGTRGWTQRRHPDGWETRRGEERTSETLAWKEKGRARLSEVAWTV